MSPSLRHRRLHGAPPPPLRRHRLAAILRRRRGILQLHQLPSPWRRHSRGRHLPRRRRQLAARHPARPAGHLAVVWPHPLAKKNAVGAQDGGAVAAAIVIDQGEVRVARYDYNPRDDKAQIVLKANDFVRIFEVTESGWAAGVRLCKETMQEVGDAGWFPAGYLFPPDHVAAK